MNAHAEGQKCGRSRGKTLLSPSGSASARPNMQTKHNSMDREQLATQPGVLKDTMREPRTGMHLRQRMNDYLESLSDGIAAAALLLPSSPSSSRQMWTITPHGNPWNKRDIYSFMPSLHYSHYCGVRLNFSSLLWGKTGWGLFVGKYSAFWNIFGLCLSNRTNLCFVQKRAPCRDIVNAGA